MTPPLLGQRSRGELIAELYDRHADGLFAYCRDQLGDTDAAAAALLAVLALAPADPPRAALYALARREIHQRDVVYTPPLSGADPVGAFVERVLRGLRPHQREVLYLSGVHGMDVSELSWVLDVAADTADELAVSARRHFVQALALALASARVPERLSDAFGALGVAPIRDVLLRAPWAVPSADLRTTALSTLVAPASLSAFSNVAFSNAASPGPLKPLWPTAPAWPLPLTETDALTNTSVFPSPESATGPAPRALFPLLSSSPAPVPSPRPRPTRSPRTRPTRSPRTRPTPSRCPRSGTRRRTRSATRSTPPAAGFSAPNPPGPRRRTPWAPPPALPTGRPGPFPGRAAASP